MSKPDDVRARFEAWWVSPHGFSMTIPNTKESYYRAWQAAHADMAGEVRELVDALRLAVRQNSHDMLMTGDELRTCTAALAKHTHQEKP